MAKIISVIMKAEEDNISLGIINKEKTSVMNLEELKVWKVRRRRGRGQRQGIRGE